MRIFKCSKCEDTGKVGFVVRRICTQCNGFPEVYFMKGHKAPTVPPPPPPPGRADIVVEIRLNA